MHPARSTLLRWLVVSGMVGLAATRAAADPPLGVGVVGLKLILLDRHVASGKAKVVFVSKDPTPGAIHKGGAGDPPGLAGTVEIFPVDDPGNRLVFDLSDQPPPPGGDGGAWLVNKDTVAKYVHKTAAPGGRGAKVVVVKPDKLLKVVGGNLGDADVSTGDDGADDLDLSTITAGDTLRVRVTIANGNPPAGSHTMCSDFSDLTVKQIAGDTGYEVSSRTSTAPADCGTPCECGPAARLTFTTGVGVGTCGTVTDGSGSTTASLACGGLYFGGGQVSVPLPATVPDLGVMTTNVLACSGTQLRVTAATAAETGSLKTCSAAGCFFGPPLPIPNTGVPVLSTCVTNIVAQDADGSAMCDTGTTDLDLPLTAEVRLTGDIFADAGCIGGPTPAAPCATDADCGDGGFCSNGIQACPVCTPDSASGTGFTCRGGSNDGGDCIPGSSDLSSAHPTSHDCPPAQPLLGTLPIGFELTTGSVTRTQDPGAASGVICGFCQDADDTLLFANPPEGCVTDADCTQPFEGCRQRNPGAFADGTARTITGTGSPAGDLTDFAGHAQTLVSVFCIPPTFNGTIDASADLPGPGAVALAGSVQLSSPSGAFLDDVPPR